MRHVELRQQALRSDHPISVLHEIGDLVPVGFKIDAYADPPPVPDVGRAEELLRIVADEHLLHAGWRWAPESQPVGAVMVIVNGNELPADEEARLTVAATFGNARQRQTDLPQAADRRISLRHGPIIAPG